MPIVAAEGRTDLLRQNTVVSLDVEACLRPAGMRQDSAVLQDEQRLNDARGLLAALLPRRPAQRLQLHLPVDARELAALLQHRLAEEHNPSQQHAMKL